MMGIKILKNKRYKELLDYEEKYRELSGQCVTLWTGGRSRYKAFLSMNKEETVRRYFELNKAYIELVREYKKKVSNVKD